MDYKPVVTYESDPQHYRFLQQLQREGLDMSGVILGPAPEDAKRPKYYDRRTDNSLFWKRNERKLTQRQLATMTGTTCRTISAIENKHREPSVYLALAIAEAFGLKVEDMFYLEPLTAVKPSKH